MKGNLKQDLYQLKEQFDTYLKTHHVHSIPPNVIATLFNRYFKQQPTILAQVLVKSINATHLTEITWDNLLEFLDNEIMLRTQATTLLNKIMHNNNEEIHVMQVRFDLQPHHQQIIKWVKCKKTNMMRQMKRIDMMNKQLILIRMDKEMFLYDINTKSVIKSIQYKYTSMKNKIMIKNNNKLLKNQSLVKQSQCGDIVNPISESHLDRSKGLHNQNYDEPRNLRTTYGRRSIRGSNKSSQISYKRRAITEGGQLTAITHHRKPASLLKYRTNDTTKIFKLFKNATLQNSTKIAKAFMQSRNNFLSHMAVEKDWIKSQVSYQIKQVEGIGVKKNFQHQVDHMRKFSSLLSSNHLLQDSQDDAKIDEYRKSSLRKKQNKQIEIFKNIENKSLQIECISVSQSYILVSLHNREVRLYECKKSIHSFREQIIFQEVYDNIAVFLLLYKSQVRQLYNIVICLNNQKHLDIIVYSLKPNMHLGNEMFKTKISFLAIMKSILPLGIIGFNQRGWLTMIELNSPINIQCEAKTIEKVYLNPVDNDPISITCGRIHNNLVQLYIACKKGYIYSIDKYTQSIRSYKKICNSSINDFLFINNSQTIVALVSKNKNQSKLKKNQNSEQGLLNGGYIKIINSRTFNIDYSYFIGQTFNQNLDSDPYQLLMITQSQFGIYKGRSVMTFQVFQNTQSKFQTNKPLMKYKSKQKIFQRKNTHLKTQSNLKNQLNYKSINGSILIKKIFVTDSFLAILGVNFQISVYNIKLQYLGSYHSLELQNVVDIALCYQQKYLAIYFQSGELQIINLYTSEILMTISMNQQIQCMIFGDNQSSFINLLSRNILYFYPKQKNAKLSRKISMNEFYDQGKVMVKFVNGRLISWTQIGIITFHYPKSYLRDHCINLRNYFIQHQYNITQFTLLKIKHSCSQSSNCFFAQVQIDSYAAILKIEFSRKIQIILKLNMDNIVDYGFDRFIIKQSNSIYILRNIKQGNKIQGKITNNTCEQIHVYGNYIISKDQSLIKVYSKNGELLQQIGL